MIDLVFNKFPKFYIVKNFNPTFHHTDYHTLVFCEISVQSVLKSAHSRVVKISCSLGELCLSLNFKFKAIVELSKAGSLTGGD